MITRKLSIENLLKRGLISKETADKYSYDVADNAALTGGNNSPQPGVPGIPQQTPQQLTAPMPQYSNLPQNSTNAYLNRRIIIMEFSYVAVNEKNRKYRNRMTANTKEEVKRKLEQRGLIAISIDEVKKGSQEDIPIWQRDLGGSKDVHTLKISNKRLLTFMHQMALMIRSGISLSVAMAVMCDTEKDKNMLRILQEITANLYNGITLSQSLSSFKTFPTVYVNIIQTGEANGRLDEAFDKCVSLLKKEITLREQDQGCNRLPYFPPYSYNCAYYCNEYCGTSCI